MWSYSVGYGGSPSTWDLIPSCSQGVSIQNDQPSCTSGAWGIEGSTGRNHVHAATEYGIPKTTLKDKTPMNGIVCHWTYTEDVDPVASVLCGRWLHKDCVSDLVDLAVDSCQCPICTKHWNRLPVTEEVVFEMTSLVLVFASLHFRGFDCTQTYVNAFGTKLSVCNIIDGRFQGYSQGGVSLYSI